MRRPTPRRSWSSGCWLRLATWRSSSYIRVLRARFVRWPDSARSRWRSVQSAGVRRAPAGRALNHHHHRAERRQPTLECGRTRRRSLPATAVASRSSSRPCQRRPSLTLPLYLRPHSYSNSSRLPKSDRRGEFESKWNVIINLFIFVCFLFGQPLLLVGFAQTTFKGNLGSFFFEWLNGCKKLFTVLDAGLICVVQIFAE